MPGRARTEDDADFNPRAAELTPLTGSVTGSQHLNEARSSGSASDGDDAFDTSFGNEAGRPASSPSRPAWASAWKQRAGGPTETCLVLLTAYATIVGLFMLQSVMVPLVTALFISTLLLPLLDLLTERPLRCCRRVWCQRTCRACLSLEERHPNNCCCTVATSFLTIRLPNPVALMLVVGLMLSFFFAVGVIVQQSVMQFTEQLPLYE